MAIKWSRPRGFNFLVMSMRRAAAPTALDKGLQPRATTAEWQPIAEPYQEPRLGCRTRSDWDGSPFSRGRGTDQRRTRSCLLDRLRFTHDRTRRTSHASRPHVLDDRDIWGSTFAAHRKRHSRAMEETSTTLRIGRMRSSGRVRLLAYRPNARGSMVVIDGTNAMTSRQTNRIASSRRTGRTVSSSFTFPMAQEP